MERYLSTKYSLIIYAFFDYLACSEKKLQWLQLYASFARLIDEKKNKIVKRKNKDERL